MFSSVLIANRGEIAVRIARTARAMGLRTIAVYSDADAQALHVRVCDESLPIGPAPASESYLAVDRLIAAAKRAGADCIHPGYGFLSENADFAEACAQAGIVFVGPPPEAIRAMGLKNRAKVLMAKAGVPVVPGYHGERQEPGFLRQKAYELGYPVLIKAVAGGGDVLLYQYVWITEGRGRFARRAGERRIEVQIDRKSTRLNSSHMS